MIAKVGTVAERETTRKRPGPRRSPGARPTDDALLDAARAVFADCGFQQATMEAIAERANSTKPTLYAHFGDKEALYRALIAREAEAVSQWVTAAYETAGDLPMDRQVHVYVMAMFTYASAHPESFRMIFDAKSIGDAARLRLVDTITERVSAQIRTHLLSLGLTLGRSVDLLAAAMVGVVGKTAEATLRMGDLDPLTAGEFVTDFLTAALTNLEPSMMFAVDGVAVDLAGDVRVDPVDDARAQPG
jgi:AcrR family transcriptional regulator